MLEVWREYYEKLLNEKFMWRRDGLETLAPTEGPCEQFTVEEVRNAIHLVKNGKATGPSSDMLKCSGEAGVRWVTDLCNGGLDRVLCYCSIMLLYEESIMLL